MNIFVFNILYNFNIFHYKIGSCSYFNCPAFKTPKIKYIFNLQIAQLVSSHKFHSDKIFLLI